MLFPLIAFLLGYQWATPGWVRLGEWNPVPTDYEPAGMSDFPVYRLPDPEPARPNSEMGN